MGAYMPSKPLSRTIPLRILFASVLLFAAVAPGPAQPPLEQLFARVEQSVVRVQPVGNGNNATGFVWANGTVVTSLHVVDGSSAINVYYPRQRVRRTAVVERVLRNADLVLLRVTNAPPVPGLSHATALPGLNEDIHVLGYRENDNAINSYTFKMRFGGRRLRDNVSSQVVQRLVANGYPDPALDVLKLGQESLLPGLSGAPIFNGQGQVVGIGDGGLQEGAINVSWGVPARYLDALATSSVRALPNAPGTRELFAAELDANVGTEIVHGSAELIRVRTRTFAEMAATADDALGLSQLAGLFARFNPATFRYDIYQDARSGATVVVPEGSTLTPQGGFLRVTPPAQAGGGGRMEMVLRVARIAAGPAALNAASQAFERDVGARHPGVRWMVDPQWTYNFPLSRYDGLVARRVAGIGLGAYGEPLKYTFETRAGRNNTFVGIAVVNNDNTMPTNQQEMQCAQGMPLPNCPALFSSRRLWAQMVLGVQMTSFAQ